MNLASYAEPRSWLNPRNVRGWLLLLLSIYAVAGYFLLPWLVQEQLPVQSQALIKRTATAEKVSFNPFTLQLRAQEFRLADSDDGDLATAAEVHINLQLRSLLRFAIVLGDLELSTPRVYLTRFADGQSNIGRLLTDLEPDTEAVSAETSSDSEEMLRVVIDRLRIADGEILLEDQVTEETFSTRVGPVNISLDNFSTLPDDSGEQSVRISTETGARLSWAGNLTVNPLQSSGQLSVAGSPLGIAHRYLREQLNFEFENCCLDLTLNYTLSLPPGGEFQAAVDDLNVSLRELSVRSADDSEDIVSLPAMDLSGGQLRWPEATLRIAAINVEKPVLRVWSGENGQLNLGELLEQAGPVDAATAEQPEDTAVAGETDAGLPLEITVSSLRINSMRADYIDRALDNPAPLELQDIELQITDLSTIAGNRAPVTVSASVDSGGEISASGSVSLMPDVAADLAFSLNGFALNALQPWADDAAFVSLDNGVLSLEGKLSTAAGDLQVERTAVSVNNLQVSDTRLGERLAGWQQLRISGISAATSAGNAGIDLGIGGISLDEPFGRLLIDEAGGTNFGSLAKPSSGTSSAEPAEPSAPLRLRVGESRITGGRLDFTDQSLPLPFSALISDFGGSVSAFNSATEQLSTLDFKGNVGEYGLSTISGGIDLADPTGNADITAEFRNVSMPETSPYTVEFVGQKIAAGKLDLDLWYRFEDRKVSGDNDITLREFELGDKFDHPEAMDLPLGVAVGLLRDVNGIIDMDLKVSGDLDDPAFSARNLILKALANLITKAVAAPFKLLGALVPELGDDSASQVAFAPGSAELLPPEREKLRLLSEALEQRPGLVLMIPGGVSAELDTAALQQTTGAAEISVEQLTELGAQRRAAMLEELRSLGLPENRVMTGAEVAGGSDAGLVTIELGLEIS